jgi:hypothetical protein
VGTKVRLRHDVDRYPHFIAPKGATGTVTKVDDEVLIVSMDQPISGAEDWDNEVHWFDDLRPFAAHDLELVHA